MPAETEKNNQLFIITFVLAAVAIVYFISSVAFIASDPSLFGIPESYLSWMVIERLVLTGIIVGILIILSAVMKGLPGVEAGKKPVKKPSLSKKDLKEDLMRYYRDLGAFKILLKDGNIDTKTYNERKKSIEEMIKQKKKQIEAAG